MALLNAAPGSRLTQPFGKSSMSVEPTMYYTGTEKAYWQPYPGQDGVYANYHGGVDRAAPLGSRLIAPQDGKIVFAAWSNNGGGNVIKLEIRPGSVVELSHCQGFAVGSGQRVERGQTIAYMGSTGWSTGSHTHEVLALYEKGPDGIYRTMCYNVTLFEAGGKYEDDPRIKPIAQAQYVQLNGPGINIRSTPQLGSGENIFATSASDGIYRLGENRWPLTQRMRFDRWVDRDGIRWARAYLGGGYRFIAKSLVHFA